MTSQMSNVKGHRSNVFSMDNQTQKTILVSLIVALITTVPFAILISYLTITYLNPAISETVATSSVSDVLKQVDQSTNVPLGSTNQPSETSAEMSIANEVLQPNQQTAQTEAGRLAIARTIFTTDKAIYTLNSSFIQKNGKPYNQQSIERSDLPTGEKKIWIEDLKSLDGTGSIQSGQEFIIFSNPKQGTNLYLEVIGGGGTELIGMDLYKLSLADKSLKRLLVSSVVTNRFGQYAISPNGLQVLFPPLGEQKGLDQDIMLVNLDQDTSTRLFSLTGNETFNAGDYGLSAHTNIRWVDNENFVYAVYDQSLKPANPDNSSEGIAKVFLEERSYSLNVK